MLSGFTTGYNTLDLLAALFFGPTIWKIHSDSNDTKPSFKRIFCNASIGFILLGLIYWGLARVAAGMAESLIGIEQRSLLPQLSKLILGQTGSILANLAVCLACLTTVIGLTLTVSYWIDDFAPQNRINTNTTSFVTLLLTMLVAQLGFDQIMIILGPILSILYPCLIALTIGNIVQKFYGFDQIRPLVGITFLCSILANLY